MLAAALAAILLTARPTRAQTHSHVGQMSWFGDSGNWASVGRLACGDSPPAPNQDLFAAMSVHALSDPGSIKSSGVCGQCIRIEFGPNSVVVAVADVMLRENASPDDLDLSNAAFASLADLSVGLLNNVGWDFVECSSGALLLGSLSPNNAANATQTMTALATMKATGVANVVAMDLPQFAPGVTASRASIVRKAASALLLLSALTSI
ncbi:hypothetical protein CcCBS67573_g10154 [Chytriomyces confervae]|uniref:Expansin-like EG45 domain-containing protein n=1 Tax=Chytriomyces confervae TaxID=246404 RepID=A0A507DCY1_9FUNG|nr:hypothetical protein CcCBS67573_g10154 [Chytriomyces confervae]